jgi:transcriptional regulator with XRE-family HTH domain
VSKAKRALSVNQIFAYRLRDARLSKQWKQQDLANAMEHIGHPINRATIAKIEAGARGVGGGHGRDPIKRGETPPRPASLEEAIAFAVALDVPPPSLFLPIIREDAVQLAPKVRVEVEAAHAWARGEAPLDPSDGQFYRFQTFARRATLADLEALGIRIVQEEPNDER